MTLLHHLNHTAASYGLHRSLAISAIKQGDTHSARWHARHARSDWRTLCHISKQTAPTAHRTADAFAA